MRELLPELERIRALADEMGALVPDEFRCPLCLELMLDPVCTADGQTYERSYIEAWLNGHDVSPLTNETLAHKHLTPNLALKQLIKATVNQPPVVAEARSSSASSSTALPPDAPDATWC